MYQINFLNRKLNLHIFLTLFDILRVQVCGVFCVCVSMYLYTIFHEMRTLEKGLLVNPSPAGSESDCPLPPI